MAKSIEPKIKDWFQLTMAENKTPYCIEQESINKDVDEALTKAPSKSGNDGKGRPDFQMVIKDNSTLKEYPVMIEAKGLKDKLHSKDDGQIVLVTKRKKDSKPGAKNPYKVGDDDYSAIEQYAVNGAVYYAMNIIRFSTSYQDVIAVGINGHEDSTGIFKECEIYYVSKDNMCVPKLIGTNIELLAKSNWPELLDRVKNANLTVEEREQIAKRAEDTIDNNLQKINEMMEHGLNIQASSRVHLIAGMIMAGLGVPGEVAPLEVSELKSYSSII